MQPKTGVAIILATPMIVQQCDNAGPSSWSPCTKTCCTTSQVIIKAIPRSGGVAGPNPLVEISSLQLLNEHQGHGHDDEESHVIRLLDCLEDEEYFYLVLPYLTKGDLFHLVHVTSGQGLKPNEAARYFRQMIQGLLFMKQRGLAHHDVSLENVCIAGDDTIRIIDLGMCLRVPWPTSSSSSSGDAISLSPQPCRGKANYVVSQPYR